MMKTGFARFFIVSSVTLGILFSSSSGARRAAVPATTQVAEATDPRLDMIKTLQALDPDPELGDQAKVFGRFVGTWDVEYHFFTKNGKPAGRFSGEVISGWVMDGHVLQDLFIAYPMDKNKERSMGTTLRYFDPWSFNDIRADSFVWRGEKSSDEGKTWWMEEQHPFKRRTPTSNATAASPRLDMINTLQALGPHPSLDGQAQVFGRFVGTWDVDYGEIDKDGKVTHHPGELVVGWIMDGHALQDLFIAAPMSAGEKRTMGTTLRYFDSKSGKWHVTYIEPPTTTLVELTGGQEGDRIMLYCKTPQGSLLRWSFNDIKDDSFTWQGESSHDGGKTWRLMEEHHMKRRTATSATKQTE